MKVKVLGTQSPYATKNHNCPGFLVSERHRKILLDCGSGVHRYLNYPEDLEKLTVILTHLHRDHYSDIYNILYASYVFHNQNRLDKQLEILLPKTPTEIYRDLISEESSYATFHEINDIAAFYDYVMFVDFMKVDHPVETYAVKISGMSHCIVYTSDTSFSSKNDLVSFAKDADMLICESSFLSSYGIENSDRHLTAKQAAIIAKEANVTWLMLTHFWPEEKTDNYLNEALEVFPDVIIAKEGMVIDFPI